MKSRKVGKKKPAARKGSVKAGGRDPLGRSAWLDAARDALMAEGVAGMEVNKLAKRLGVTRGGFYWFFKSSEQLRDELLSYWESTSTTQFESVLRGEGHNGVDELRAVVDLWVEEKDYKPAWDAAVRDWARTSARVARVVRRVDGQRVAVLHQVFLDLGFTDPDALIRARITYYHQVGYYALGVRQTRKERLQLLPHYLRALSGR